MNARVVVVDYGLGNLLNVARAFEYCGARVDVTDDPGSLAKAERIVLPGVGAFADGMTGLRGRNLVSAIEQHAQSGRPLLGICLGMQLLFEESEEFGPAVGLGLLKGRVVRIPGGISEIACRKIPHIGWNELYPAAGRSGWDNTFFRDLGHRVSVYFVHSYSAVPAWAEVSLAQCDHEGFQVCAAIEQHNLYGCQFHPEKSGEAGLQVLRRFLTL